MALTDKLTNIADAIREKTGSTRTMNLEEMAAAVTNIKIPTALSDLNEDETHRTVTDAEKKTWNDKSDFSGNYDDLKNKQLAGTTDELTPTQVYEAVSTGRPVKVQYTDRTYGALSFTAFNVAESPNVIVSQTIVYVNGEYILAELNGNKSDNTWGFNTTTMAQKADIPAALPNPNALTFTGAVTGSYDGSAPLSVAIPSGEGGTGGGSSDTWELINTITVGDDAPVSVTFSADSNGNAFALKKFYLMTTTAPKSSYLAARINNKLGTEQFKTGTLAAASVTAFDPIRIIFQIVDNGFYKFENTNTNTITYRRDGEICPNGGKQSHIDSVSSISFVWGTSVEYAEGDVFTLYGVRT